MSPGVGIGDHARERFPRVSGDEPSSVSGGGAYSSFSPRERG